MCPAPRSPDSHGMLARMTADEVTDTPEPDASGTREAPVKVCPKCSVQERTSGLFCPHCGAPYAKKQRLRSKRSKRILAAAVGLLLVAGLGGGITAKVNHDNSVKAEKKRQADKGLAERKRQADEAAAAEKERVAKEAATAARKKRAADKKELDKAIRDLVVRDMEKSITKDAKKMVAGGTLDGPILRTSCSSTNPAANKTTAPFSCIAVTETNGSTERGYRFSATANLKSGSYRWHLGD